ncbi:MAG: ATP-dependent Clp protease proteolytic subunit [Lachnospiraceae bacterium]|nr:ATP-dependent Clp protease proteolytic subunit [Lachnospiraceae bacterium]
MTRYAKETAKGIEILALEEVLYSSREIFLTEEVNSDTSVQLIKELMVLEKLDPTKEVTLYINSPGGEVISGMAVYDYIQMMKAPVKTVCIGTAASMGAMLFLAGDKREMLPHTRLMIHDPAFGGGNMAGKKPHELQQYVDKLKQTQDIIVDIIAQKTGKSKEEVRDTTKEDAYFNVAEAMEYGLATGIYNKLNDTLGNENLVLL